MATVKKKAPQKKAAPKKAASEKKSAPKKVTPKIEKSAPKATLKKVATTVPVVTEDERMQMIATAAYFKAEQRGFVGGNPEQDWADAEREVNELLSKK